MATITKRKRNGGRASYQAEVRITGFPPVRRTFDTAKQAKAWAAKTEQRQREGKLEATESAALHSAVEMIERYRTDHLPHKSDSAKYIRHQTQQLAWWEARLQGYTLDKLTASVMVAARDDLRKTRKPATVNRYIAAISHVFTIARKQWQWLPESPLPDDIWLREPAGRVRFLDDAEKGAILRCCRDVGLQLYMLVVLLVATGARKSEVLGLRWKDVDFQRGRATLHHTKNRERRAIHLHGLSAAILQHRRKYATPSALIFAGIHNDTLERQWRRARQAAMLSDFRLHDLRHTFASYAAMTGMDTLMLAEALGHKDIKMVKRYAHLMDSHVSEGVRKANERVFGTEENQP